MVDGDITKNYSRPRGSHSVVKGLDSKVRSVAHESVKDSPHLKNELEEFPMIPLPAKTYWTEDFLGGVTGRRCHGLL